MTHEHHPGDGGDRELGRLVRDAYHTPVDVETASRHLWRVHQAARGRRVGPSAGARRTLVSALAAVLLFATTGTAVALSGQSVPGDSLYTVKRGAERLHLLVSFAPDSDARLHLRFARSRVDEAERVAATRPEAVPGLLSDLVESVGHARASGGPDLDEEVDLVRREVTTALASLGGSLDEEVAASLDDALRALEDEAVTAGASPPASVDGSAEQGGDPGAGDGGGEQDGAGDGGDGAVAGAQRPASPDRTVPPAAAQPATPQPEHLAGVAGDAGDEPAEQPGEVDGDDPAREDEEHAEPAVPVPGDTPAGPTTPLPDPVPGDDELAAERTMPTLERLEGLLDRP